MNTTRRKEELINAISDPKNKSQFQSARKDQSLLQKRSGKENSPWQKVLPFAELSDNEKTKRHNYFMTEDFV